MKKVIFILLAFVLAYSAQAQAYLNDSRYGATPEERTENAKLYAAFGVSYGLKDWAQATKELKELLQKVPKVSENLYIKGVEIYRQKYATATNDADRKVAMDSLLLLFDIRAEQFANHPSRGVAYVLAQKARMYSQLNPNDKPNIFKFHVEAIEAGKNAINQEVVGQYFAMVTESFKFDEITLDEYMTRYDGLTATLKGSSDPTAKEALASVDAIFATSGAADCENIEKIFRPKFEADPTNNELLKQILGLFNHSHCQNQWQMDLLEKYYENDPKPEFALMLAGVYEDKKDYAKALEYIEVAIKNETDPVEKVKHLLRAAGQTLSLEKYDQTANFSKQVLDLDPDNGMACNFYASAVAGAVNIGCSGFEKQAAYWLVVDYYVKALKNIPADDPQNEQVRKAIAVYSANFPKKDELFMRGMEDGTPYNVRCSWVTGSTTVRGRN